MIFGSQKGQTSIFFMILFVPVMIVSLIIIDAARISTARKQVEDAVRSAAKSALAAYSSKIKEEYGLFVSGPKAEGEAEEEIKKYLCKNMGIDKNGSTGGAVKLYDYSIEGISVTPVVTLAQNEAAGKQILEYMKYRAPVMLTEGLIEKLRALGDTSGVSKAYKMKISMDSSLSKMDKVIRELKEYTEGWNGRSAVTVNSFSRRSREKTIQCLADSIISRRELIKPLMLKREKLTYLQYLAAVTRNEIDMIHESVRVKSDLLDSLSDDNTDEIAQIRQEISELAASAQQKQKNLELLSGELLELDKTVTELERQLDDIEDDIESDWSELERRTFPYLDANKSALQAAQKVRELGSEITSLVEQLKQLAKSEKSGSPLWKTFWSELQDELIKSCVYILEKQTINRITESLKANESILRQLKSVILQYDGMVSEKYDLPGDRDSIINLLKGRQDSYDTSVSVKYDRAGQNKSEDDPRKGIAEKAKDFFRSSIYDYGDIADSGFDIDMLPSRQKVKNRRDDLTFMGDPSQLDREVGFEEKNSSFSAGAFGFLGELGDITSEDLTSMRDDLYINEYILTTLYNSSQRNIRDRESFFTGEAEYVIHGMPSGRLNLLAVKGEITLIRFALNTLHVYTDAKKKALAAGIATAAAGWWTGGAGIPVISNMIMCSWGMGEALLDVKRLLDGDEVPVFKTRADWQLDIKLLKGGGNGKSSFNINAGYEDYLRLLLLAVPRETRLDRIRDIICLNLYGEGCEWDPGSYSTCIRVDAVVSVNYLFLPRIDLPGIENSVGGRKEFSIVIHEGY